MTQYFGTASGAPAAGEARAGDLGAWAPWLAVLVALAGYLLLGSDRVLDIWRHGAFYDTDDATRMVQVRDLLAGQAWYDMTAWRFDPPHGMFSHWARVVDAPLAALVLLFRLFLDGVLAERAARIAFPALLAMGLFVAGLYAARVFAGRSMRLFGVAAMLFCGVLFWQFPAGRIDHHAPQITALLVAVAAMAACFGKVETRKASALSGVMTALSLSIGLENLPFLALVAAAPMALYVWRGLEARETLYGFACGLAGALIPLFLATVGPKHWFFPACDALSAPYVLACLAGCVAYALMARFGAASPPRARLAVAGLACLCAVAPLGLMPAACLADPYYGIDPLVRKYWLDPNPEVISIVRQAQLDANLALLLVAPTLVGLVAALFGVWRCSGSARARWAFLAAQIALGVVLGALHIRIFSTVMPLVAIGLLAPVAFIREAVESRVSEQTRGLIGALTGLIALFALSNMGLMIELPEIGPAAPTDIGAGRDRCMNSASYEPLRALEPGLAVSMISPGAYLLAHTDLGVMAGPYHRNRGNRGALDILFAPPDKAEALARAAGARYVILCWGADAAASWKSWSPDGLAARIAQGSVPGWLRPVQVENTPVHVYELVGAGENSAN
ncbi:hypothetical protein CCR94_19415 [Rhodoblastus sphagnicola]|uniref:Glycosyltransferase RgtA/B/C/D-like domain-containing protein n=1 Tax=Rhodoblastus sphagnicola TaxID=333368 RepID=A0A2S6MZ46_9HYPH|nr:hypothetical protein [Rhodoblastus sphagnicola]MBB4198639.1 hypothetical protein [Rhodoblastus sphagnicola]PPQ27645.1 hypothetical protein CCR94_19415 [Rhodoblastus sphagnicola]